MSQQLQRLNEVKALKPSPYSQLNLQKNKNKLLENKMQIAEILARSNDEDDNDFSRQFEAYYKTSEKPPSLP